jgi:hypothetical protein
MKRNEYNRKCKNCGELEMVGHGAEFGWFTTDEGTHCNRCGLDPMKKAPKPKVAR